MKIDFKKTTRQLLTNTVSKLPVVNSVLAKVQSATGTSKLNGAKLIGALIALAILIALILGKLSPQEAIDLLQLNE